MINAINKHDYNINIFKSSVIEYLKQTYYEGFVWYFEGDELCCDCDDNKTLHFGNIVNSSVYSAWEQTFVYRETEAPDWRRELEFCIEGS